MTQSNQVFECLKKNNLRQIFLLLSGGNSDNVDVTDNEGRSLLMMCMVQVHDQDARFRLMTQLLHKGVDVNKTDSNGKCALTYSCALNQPASIILLLDQAEIDPNIPDIHGATPLMHATSLGHLNAVKTMMECHHSGTVTIDMKARDDNGNSAMDHAKNAKNNQSFNKQQQREFAVNSRKVQNILEECGDGDSGDGGGGGGIGSGNGSTVPLDASHRRGNNNRHNNGDEAIELKDLKNTMNKRQTGDRIAKNAALQNSEHRAHSAASVSNVPPEIRASCIRRWAVDLKAQQEESSRMSALISPPSASSASRPGSRQDINKGRPLSSLSTTSKSNNYLGKPEEEDDEFSLESLSDLVGTVRQYAQEIREIYAPIQKDEEERTKRRKEKMTKRKSKSLQKTFVAKVSNARNLAPPPVHEVCVEIHKPEDNERQQKSPGFSQSHSYDPSSTQPIASLHVENEQLSSTWPRGRQRAKSEDRNRSSLKGRGADRKEAHGSKVSVVSAPGPSTSFSRPQIPQDWSEKVSLEHEREILNNAFKRFHNSNEDPLLKSISENKRNMKLRQHLTNSRQSVIQVGKSHHQTTTNNTASVVNEVPTISIIPPPSDPLSASSHLTRHDRFHNESEMMSGHAMPDNVITIDDNGGKMPKESKNGGNGVKSSTKGLRRRKSVEQGMGQSAVVDKY